MEVTDLAIIFTWRVVSICQIYSQYGNANYQNNDKYDHNMTRKKQALFRPVFSINRGVFCY